MGDFDKYHALKKLIPDRSSREFMIKMIESLTNIVIIMDIDRRIVYSNQNINGQHASSSARSVLNMRPGEVFQCVNANKTPSGCGTSDSCEFCGAFRAMKISRDENKSVTSHYRILGKSSGNTKTYNFRFTSTPFECSDGFFYVATLEDISNEKRSAELEKIFYHDLMNSIGNLNGIIHLIKSTPQPEEKYINLLELNYNSLYDTVYEQKQISMAEKGELKVRIEEIHTADMLIETKLAFEGNHNLKDMVILAENQQHCIIATDYALLSRVIVNMLKNALQASEENEKIVLGFSENGDYIRFYVKNRAIIPENIKPNIFQRSFSTKGIGRGLGTYSMKLLGENYLGGKVDFNSTREDGTIFWIDVPMHP